MKTRVIKMSAELKNKIVKILFFSLLLGLLAVEITHAIWKYNDDLYLCMSRFIGGTCCIVFMADFSITKILKPTGNKKLIPLLLALPGFIIAVNNFPFVSFFANDCGINFNLSSIITFAVICLGTGFFEEMAFRGCAFTLLLKSRTQSKSKIFLAIFLSSVVFGAVHFVNIFFGASPMSVILQIGYSALIGALCSMVLLLTGNIWLCVLLHSIYNFCGGLVDRVGYGVLWTSEQMSFTAIIAVIVAVYFVVLFVKLPTSYADNLFDDKIIKKSKAE